MEDGLAEAIDEGKVGPRDDPKTRGKLLTDDFGWDKVPSRPGLLLQFSVAPAVSRQAGLRRWHVQRCHVPVM